MTGTLDLRPPDCPAPQPSCSSQRQWGGQIQGHFHLYLARTFLPLAQLTLGLRETAMSTVPLNTRL